MLFGTGLFSEASGLSEEEDRLDKSENEDEDDEDD